MRTTVDIPDPIYRQLKVRAATEGTTIKEIILESLALKMRMGESQDREQRADREPRARFPVIRSRNPGTLHLGEEGVYEYIPFP